MSKQTRGRHPIYSLLPIEIDGFDSLAELVKLADALLKPVLHMKHDLADVYCVIDGTVRYMYTAVEPPSKGKSV